MYHITISLSIKLSPTFAECRICVAIDLYMYLFYNYILMYTPTSSELGSLIAVHDDLQEAYGAYHAANIALHEASIRTGAIALLAAKGNEVDGTLIQMRQRSIISSYATGFLIAGEVEHDTGVVEVPVVSVSTYIPNDSFNAIMNKTVRRDTSKSPDLATESVCDITDMLSGSPITIQSGTIRNKRTEADDGVWTRFTQTTAKRGPAFIQKNPYNNDQLLRYVHRRLRGSVVKGYFQSGEHFAEPNPSQLTSMNIGVPKLDIRSYQEAAAIYADPERRWQLFESKRLAAEHNARVAKDLFANAGMSITEAVDGKMGRLWWYGKSSALSRLSLALTM